jgi:hypothetical protein
MTASAADLEALVAKSDLDGIILRVGALYGSGTNRDDRWRHLARAEELRLRGDGAGYISLIHVTNMADAIVLGAASALSRVTLSIVDDEPMTYATLFRHVATIEHGPEPQSGGPRTLPSFRVTNARARDDSGARSVAGCGSRRTPWRTARRMHHVSPWKSEATGADLRACLRGTGRGTFATNCGQAGRISRSRSRLKRSSGRSRAPLRTGPREASASARTSPTRSAMTASSATTSRTHVLRPRPPSRTHLVRIRASPTHPHVPRGSWLTSARTQVPTRPFRGMFRHRSIALGAASEDGRTILYCCTPSCSPSVTYVPELLPSSCGPPSVAYVCFSPAVPDGVDPTLECTRAGAWYQGTTGYCCVSGNACFAAVGDLPISEGCSDPMYPYYCAGQSTPSQPGTTCTAPHGPGGRRREGGAAK